MNFLQKMINISYITYYGSSTLESSMAARADNVFLYKLHPELNEPTAKVLFWFMCFEKQIIISWLATVTWLDCTYDVCGHTFLICILFTPVQNSSSCCIYSCCKILNNNLRHRIGIINLNPLDTDLLK